MRSDFERSEDYLYAKLDKEVSSGSFWAGLLRFESISDVMRSAGGVGPGFDVLRIALAILILAWHCLLLTYGERHFVGMDGFFIQAKFLLVPLFFTLSGFLVAGSAIRLRSVKTFLVFRSLRIFPALMVEVTLCAVLLGPLVTSLPLAQYFTDRQFFEYFGNIVGRVRFELPGVFADNPYPRTVNGSLWTLQPEFYCYLLMAGIMALKLVYNRALYSVAFLLSIFALAVLDFKFHIGMPGAAKFWWLIVYCFFVGIFFFHWKEKIYVNPLLGGASFILATWMLNQPGLGYLSTLPACYTICCIGMTRMPEFRLLKSGDYSYGIYLFGYPIQQTVMHFFPKTDSWILLFVVALALSWGFAALSWHYVEKPAIKFKKHFLAPRPAS